jgi:tetratricopeptide (TPR) repeat protein
MGPRSILFVLAAGAAVWAQQRGGGQPLPEAAQQAQQLTREGKYDEANAAWRKAASISPNALVVMNAAGIAYDVMGKPIDAQRYFSRAIDLAENPLAKANAQRAMAMSFGFAGDCKNAAKYEEMVAGYYSSVNDAYNVGEMYDEAARVCIDSGDFANSEKYYRMGHDAGLKQADIPADRVKLWNFRLEHALARLAARRGSNADAAKHVAAAKQLVDSMDELKAQQQAFFPQLVAYVAFYAGDYKKALENFQQSNQNDAFVQCMTAETYEKMGDKTNAAEWYKKAFETGSRGHNPPAAYATRVARPKLKS